MKLIGGDLASGGTSLIETFPVISRNLYAPAPDVADSSATPSPTSQPTAPLPATEASEPPDPSATRTLAWSSVGLLLTVGGYARGWASQPYALALFYVGLIVIAVPCGWSLLASGASRRTLMVVSTGLGVLLYLAYFLSSPLIPTRFDESLHVATLQSLLEGRGLFHENPLLPISPYYPGLELVTAAVRWLSGLPLVACEFAVLLACRISFTIVLFLLVERYSRSAQVAGIAVGLYATSSQFFFFNAQFAYQSLAIVFTVSAIYAAQQAMDAPALRPTTNLMPLLLLAALDITHHLVSWLTIGLFLAWAVALALVRRRRDASIVGLFSLVAGTVALAWAFVLGARLTGYLGPLFATATDQLAGVVSGDSPPRAAFTDASGDRTPGWEVLAIYGSVAIWIALAMVSSWRIVRGRTLGRGGLRLLPAAVAIAYPLLVAARVSPTATEMAERASTFVALALALTAAAWLTPKVGRIPRVLLVTAFVILMLGGTILGSGPDWSRIPGRYLVVAEQRSVDAANLAAVRWAGNTLPAQSRVASDLTLARLFASGTTLKPVTPGGGDESPALLFFAPTVDDGVRGFIKRNRVDYVAVDTRLASAKPRSGWYFEGKGTGADAGDATLTEPELAKFETAPGFVKVLDGTVRIYDVRTIAGRPANTRAPEPPAGVAQAHPEQLAWATTLCALAWFAVWRRRQWPERAVWLGPVLLAGLLGLGMVGALTDYPGPLGAMGAAAVVAGGCLWARTIPKLPADGVGLRPRRRLTAAVLGCSLALSTNLAVTSARQSLFPERVPEQAETSSQPVP